MLSKYHAIFLPAGVVIYLLLDARRRRRRLLEPGPYIAVAAGLLVFSPVLIWNARHGWVSFLFQGGRAVGGWVPRPDYLAGALLAQAGYLFPWIWIPLVVLLVRGWRRLADDRRGPRAALALRGDCPPGCLHGRGRLPPGLAALGPDWPGAALPDAGPRLGRTARSRDRPPDAAAWSPTPACPWRLVALTLVEFRTGWFQRGEAAPLGILNDRTDPTLDFYGWDEVVARIRRLGLVDDPRSFIFTRYWYQSAQLGYALGGDRPALCYNSDDSRGFAFWSRPEDWIGRDGVLILVGNEPEVIARYFKRWFAKVEPVAEFSVERHGKPVRRIRLYRCIDQRVPYPFAIDRGHQLARRRVSPAGSAGERTAR